MRPWAISIGSCLFTATMAFLVATDRFAIGVRGQWTYGVYRNPVPTHDEHLWIPILGAILLSAALAGAWSRLASRRSAAERWGWLLALLCGGVVYTTGLILVSRLSTREPAVIAWTEWAGGFFNDARRLKGETEVAARYPEVCRRLSPHGRTHPPGPVAAFAAGMTVFRENPSAARRVREFADEYEASLEGFEYPNLEYPGSLPLPPVQDDAEWAALFSIAWLTTWGALLAAVPIYLLGRRLGEADADRTALAAGAAWLVVPALGFFAPWMDLLNPLFSATAAWCACRALQSSGGRAMGWWLLSGGVLGASILMCYSQLASVAFVGCWALIESWRRRQGFARSLTIAAVCLAAGIVAAIECVRAVTGYDGLRDLLTRNVTQLWDWDPVLGKPAGEAPRPYVTWLWGNLVEFLSFVGWPIAIGLVLGTAAALSRLRQGKGGLGESFALALVVTIVALQLSGYSRSETARIWIFFMPIACLVAMRAWPGGSGPRALVLLALAAQGIVFKLTLTTNNIVN